MEKCFDEGVIQAFLDGEMASDLSEKVACHVAVCESCAASLAFAEEAGSFAFAALDAELNSLVPTERIRSRLFETIAAERKSIWQRIFGAGFRWTNPSVAAFASLVLVVGLFATLWIVRENSSNETQVARYGKPQTNGAQPVPARSDEPIPVVNPNPVESEPSAPLIKQAAYKPKNENRVEAQKAVYRTGNTTNIRTIVDPPTPVTSYETISGEESYLKTISTLKQTVDNRKDELLKPSARVAFEKDMAVVDDAIKKMQREVRKNPKNESAKEVLRSSYQSKIDLLNSVAEKSELMASVQYLK